MMNSWNWISYIRKIGSYSTLLRIMVKWNTWCRKSKGWSLRGKLWGWKCLKGSWLTSYDGGGRQKAWRDRRWQRSELNIKAVCLNSVFYSQLNLLSCMGTIAGCWRDTICSETGGGLTTGWISEVDGPLSISVSSPRQYFVFRMLANWLAPTLRLLRASIRVLQLVLSLVVNQVLTISRSWSLGSENCVLILSSVPVLTLSCSPRWYHCADTSRTSSITWPRSSKVSLFPEKPKQLSANLWISVSKTLRPTTCILALFLGLQSQLMWWKAW